MTSSLAETPNRVRPNISDDNLTLALSRSNQQQNAGGSSPSNAKPRNGSLERFRNSLKNKGQNGEGTGEDMMSEESPLLSPTSDEDGGFIDGQTMLEETDQFQASKSVWYLVLLTVSIGGLQIAWSVELSNGSPYLLSLGLSKSLMALVWIAGPLSGTLVQPYVGMLSDNCRLSWGKRKPFMLGGAAATIVSLMLLAWSKEIVQGVSGIVGADLESTGVKYATITFAVIWVYILDFAINTVQAAIRAFIVDCAPPQQQEAANAMASRMTGVGNIIGYIAGYVNLPDMVGFLGDTQFKDLCAIASMALGGTVVLSCVLIRERDPRLEAAPSKDKHGVASFFVKIFTSIKRLPPQTAKVCMVQFCAWVGFFPMLFYTSSYIGEIYVEPFLEENPNMTPEELDRLYEDATRVGTFALLIFAITSLATNIFLPFFIAPTFDSVPIESSGEALKDYEPAPKSWLDYLIIPGFTLKRAWMMSQVLFTVSMFCTVFVRTVEAATALIGLVGITWALTLWAPWAIISAEIARRDAAMRAERQRNFSPHRHGSGGMASLDGYSSDQDRAESQPDNEEEEEKEAADQAGVILGIHNMAIAAPQIIATVASSIIFKFFQKPRGTPGDHSIAIVLALGGITVFISAFFIARIKDDPTGPTEDDYAAVEQGDGLGGGDGASTGGGTAGGEVRSRPGSGHSRSKSYEQLPRASLERATLVRNQSFGGAEY